MSKRAKKSKSSRGPSLRQQVLLAALDCSGGDLDKAFAAEDLLLAAWARNPLAWGLRGYESKHPDSERIYVELDRAQVKGGMVGLGLFEKVRQRTYRLTPAGLQAASEVETADSGFRGKAERALADEVRRILSHPIFVGWLKDPASPKRFGEAGHFWGIAPGTPSRVVVERVKRVEHTLSKAEELLEAKHVDEVGDSHGRVLYERQDLMRCRDFQNELKRRFAEDLRFLGAAELLEL